MGEIETFNGDREKILAHGKTLTKEERREYYKSVIYNLYVIRGAFKRDKYMEGIGLKDLLENEIKKIDEEINSNNYKIATERENNSEKSDPMLKRENELLTNELASSNAAIKKLNRIKFAKIDYSKFHSTEIQRYADSTRKKNQKLNYSKIAKKIGVSDHTAKNICKYHQIN